MKSASILLAGAALVAASSLLPSAQAATTYSSVLGYYTIEAPAGTSVWAPGLVTKKEHQGEMASWIGQNSPAKTVVSVADRDLSTLSLGNHYLEIIAPGKWQGLILDIDDSAGSVVSNGAGSNVRILGNLDDFLEPGDVPISQTAQFVIREHVTIGTLFDGGGGFEAFSDTVKVFRSDGSSQLATYDGTGDWLDGGNFVDVVSDEIIYPGQGILIKNNSGATKNLVVGKGGVSYVKDTPTIIPCYSGSGVINFVGLMNPLVGESPSNPALESTVQIGQMGFLDSEFGDFSDTIKVFLDDGQLSSQGSYVVDNAGNALIDGVNFTDDRTNDEVQVGTALLVKVISGVRYYKQPVLHLSN